MIERLEKLDQQLFLFLNGLHQDWLDQFMIWMSEPLFSIPVYLAVFYAIKVNYGWRVALWTVMAVSMVVLLADGISTRIFKYGFQRWRPCHNVEIADMVYLLKEGCGGKYSFVSGHATNFFGLATFFSFMLHEKMKWITPILLLWAGIIAYSRIYLGVHYPADILGGAILGIFIGWLVYRFFNNVMINLNWRT